MTEYKNTKISSIAKGRLLDLSQVPDQMFSEKLLGDGFAIDVISERVVAPMSGVVTFVYPKGHAFGIRNDAGVEVLIHVGIDVVMIDEEIFRVKVKEGSFVNQGDLLTEVDYKKITEKGFSLISPVVFTSANRINILKNNKDVEENEGSIIEFI